MRYVYLVLCALLVVLPVALLIAAVPAHLQIRSFQSPLPEFSALEQHLSAQQGPSSVAYINTATQSGPLGALGHAGVLLSWPDGRSFLIDTGMPPEKAVAFGRPMEWLLRAQPTQTFGAIHEQLGQAVQDIAGFGFTHLHSDHTNGLPGICKLQPIPATVFQTSDQYYHHNFTTNIGMKSLDEAVCPRQNLGEATITPVPGFGGLVAVPLGGHTPGSTLFAARLGDAYWLFSGDISNNKKALLENTGKHWLYSTFIVPEDTERTAELRQWLRALDARENVVVFPAHDVAEMAAHMPSAVDVAP